MKSKINLISIVFSAFVMSLMIMPKSMAQVEPQANQTELQVAQVEPQANYTLPPLKNSYTPRTAMIQTSINNLTGSSLVVDEQNNILGSKNPSQMMEPASTMKLITALAVLTKYPANSKLPGFKNKTTLQVLRYMMDTSDNGLADRLANLVGLDYVQSIARQATGNKLLTVANGSGCPRGTYGGDCQNQGSRKASYASAYDMINIVKALEATLAQQEASFASLVGGVKSYGSSGSKRFGSDFKKYPDAQVFGKTGTLNSTMSFVGMMYDRSGKKIYFAYINKGYQGQVGDVQARALVNTYVSQPVYAKY
jgi:D-alanyl-D-alanine carboxypeptidase